MWIDTHAHVSCMEHPREVLMRAKEAGLDRIINICTDFETLEKGIELEKEFPWMKNAAATTPHDVEEHGQKEWEAFSNAARSGGLIAIGETGLDFFYERAPRRLQEELLAKYCTLALECDLPLIIHCRDAFERFYEVMRSEYFQKSGARGGILHCFTGALEEAKPAMNEGWVISMSGIVTFKNSAALRAVAKEIPMEHLVIETDAPWLAPQSRRGKENEPAYVSEVGEVLGLVKGISREEVAEQTSANAQRIMGDKLG